MEGCPDRRTLEYSDEGLLYRLCNEEGDENFVENREETLRENADVEDGEGYLGSSDAKTETG